MKRILTSLFIIPFCLTLHVPVFASNHVRTEPETTIVDAAAFPDAAQIEHWEAVAALAKLGVMAGKDDGAFHPSDILTRAEAAKLSVLILYGGTVPVFEEKSSPAFSDIQGHWAEDYIEYCAKYFIVSGRGDGRFDPDGQITGLELVKIALTTLNYEAHEYKLLGDSWADQADRLARSLTPSLYQGLNGVVLTQPITRDNAAQIFYNALYAASKMVVAEYPDDNGQRKPVFADDTRSDGTPSTLLYRYFALESVGDLPNQPK